MTLSGFQPGESIAVFGGGPVGLMAAYSAVLRGASRVYVVDRVPERLDAAARIGAVPVDFESDPAAADPVARILELNGGAPVDRSVDAVGYQAVGKGGATEVPNIVLENMIRVTRACGGLGIPGLYVPTDPGAPDSAASKGMISLSFGKLFEKVGSAAFRLMRSYSLSRADCFDRVCHLLLGSATSSSTTGTFVISSSLARQSQVSSSLTR